jgi:hypothetical protein
MEEEPRADFEKSALVEGGEHSGETGGLLTVRGLSGGCKWPLEWSQEEITRGFVYTAASEKGMAISVCLMLGMPGTRAMKAARRASPARVGM